MSATDDLLFAFETHSPEKIRAALTRGASPTRVINGIPPLQSLIEMYARSRSFPDCVRAMLEAGATFGDPLLEAILLDDAGALEALLSESPDFVKRRMSLNCTFTSLREVTPLHIAAEYNSIRCVQGLIAAGADVNARAGSYGHTPLFHTVNSNRNFSRPSLELLVNAGADLDITLERLVWGEGFAWETVIYEVTALSYAQCGLFRQFQRTEEEIYGNIDYLYRRKYGVDPMIRNVPNKYLRQD